MTDQKPHPDTLADMALGLILDHPVTATALDEHARVKLGRGPLTEVDDDPEWWEAVTDATNELLARMTSLNNSGRSSS